MTYEILDERLRQLNDFEKELIDLDGRDMKLRFSTGGTKDRWRISNEKLMKDNEQIAIHKHDRFVAFDAHNHDYIEMMYVYDGSITHHFKDETIVLKKGELLLMDMNVSHSLEAASEGDVAVNILIKREFFDSYFLQQIAHDSKISAFVVNAIYNKNDSEQYLYFKSGDNKKLQALIVDILGEYFENINGMETAIRAYMLLLFNELIRNYQKYLSETMVRKVDAAIVVDVVGYIDTHYKTLTLKDMAEFFNYNSDYLGKQIKKMTGHSLRELVKMRKIKEAARLLKNTDMSIQEILETIQYSNASYFYKQFRKEFEMTPDDYRNEG